MKNITRKGFTLLEILLVITLLSIIMTILIREINPNRILSGIQDNQREADALKIYQAIEEYAFKNNTYPDDIKDIPNNSSLYICKTSAPNCASFNQINLSTDILVPTYLSKIPEHSIDTNNSGFYIVKDTNGKIGVGGVRQLDETTFVKGLESQSFENIITDGLVLYLDTGYKNSYPGTGTIWTDLSGNNNNGSLLPSVGGPTYNSANGGSLVFDGVDDYVNIGTPSIGVGKITVNAWVKINAGSLLQHIVDSASNAWHLAILNDNRPYFWNGSTYHLSAPSINVGQWYMITGVQGSTLDIYINGVLGQSVASNINVTTNNIILGGWQNGGSRRLNGNISQVSIYNRALTAVEIAQNFNTLKGRYGL